MEVFAKPETEGVYAAAADVLLEKNTVSFKIQANASFNPRRLLLWSFLILFFFF